MRHQKRRLPSDSLPAASLRARALSRVTSLTLRPLTALIPVNPPGIRLSRQLVARSMAAFGPVVRRTAINVVKGETVRGEWVRGPGAGRDDAVILYVHGSAYMLASPRTHRGMTSRLSAMTGLPVFACEYRLAPEHRFPAAADDVRRAYDWLLGEGFDPDRIVVAGDSAGGHLAVDLALELSRSGLPGPAALTLFSPLVDVTMGGAMRRERDARDPMISAARALKLIRLYTRDADIASPRLTFSMTGVDALPPTMIQAGGAEMLAADAEHLATLIRGIGGRCELEIWPGQMHVFQALPLLVPEAGPALRRAAAFIDGELAPAAGDHRRLVNQEAM